MGLFVYTKKGSIISTVYLPTTEIIEPFLFEMVTEMVTGGLYIPKNWANFSAAFLLYFRFMDVLLFKVVVVPSIVL